jgi:LPS export ABC transporter permease LptG
MSSAAMRTIADRYILKEVFAPFLLGVGAFVVILIGDILYTLAEFIAARRVAMSLVLQLLIYKLPAIFVITFPVSTLIGVLLGVGRLVKDNEIRAMRLSGMGLRRIFAAVFLFGLATTGLTFLTNEYVSPWANHQANTLVRQAAFGVVFPQVREHVFFRGPDQRVFYVGSADDRRRRLRNVMVYELASPLPRLITAWEARWDDRRWLLRDGVVRELDEDGFTRYEASFGEMEIAVGLPAESFYRGQKTPEEMTARELRQYMMLFGQTDANRRFAVEYHRKFAIPFASIVFAALAAPLSVWAAQGGRFVGIGLSIALLFVYYVAMSVAKALGSVGGLPPVVSAWTPNMLFAAAGAAAWLREEGLP